MPKVPRNAATIALREPRVLRRDLRRGRVEVEQRTVDGGRAEQHRHEQQARAEERCREQLVLLVTQASADDPDEPQEGDPGVRDEAHRDGDCPSAGPSVSHSLAPSPTRGSPVEQHDGRRQEHGEHDSRDRCRPRSPQLPDESTLRGHRRPIARRSARSAGARAPVSRLRPPPRSLRPATDRVTRPQPPPRSSPPARRRRRLVLSCWPEGHVSLLRSWRRHRPRWTR